MRCLTAAVLAATAAIVLVPDAFAQTLEEKRDRKLKSPFLSKAGWITDYDKAREAGAKSGKLIFAYFTRSYSP